MLQVSNASVNDARWFAGLRPRAAILGAVMLAAACAHSGILALRDTWRVFRSGPPDFAVAYSQRLKGVKPLLPAAGAVGYLSDSDDQGEFYLTQYLLVPLILEKGQRPDLVLVNNHAGRGGAAASEAGYTASRLADGSQVYDFGNGIKLIDRRRLP